jgi:hypothetical protein
MLRPSQLTRFSSSPSSPTKEALIQKQCLLQHTPTLLSLQLLGLSRLRHLHTQLHLNLINLLPSMASYINPRPRGRKASPQEGVHTLSQAGHHP